MSAVMLDGRERGAALVIAVILVASLIVLSGAFLTIALTETSIAANEIRSAVAFGVAEGGLEHAVAELGDTDVDDLLAGGGKLFVGRKLGSGTYSVVVTNNAEPEFPRGRIQEDSGGSEEDTDGILVVTSLGQFQTASRTVRVVVGRQRTIFDVALFASERVTTRGAATIHGRVATNGNMILSPGTTIMGGASAGGYITTTEGISGTASVGGLERTLAELACPEKEYGPAPDVPGVVFDRFSGDLVINTGSDIEWPDGTAYFHDFVRLGNGRLVVAEDDHVDLVIGGAVRVEGGGFGNDNEAAAALQLWGCGEDDRDWKIDQQGSSWMTIYAPAHRLRLTGDGVFNGSLLVGELEWVGDGTISYDAKIVDDAPFAKARGTWAELF